MVQSCCNEDILFAPATVPKRICLIDLSNGAGARTSRRLRLSSTCKSNKKGEHGPKKLEAAMDLHPRFPWTLDGPQSCQRFVLLREHLRFLVPFDWLLLGHTVKRPASGKQVTRLETDDATAGED